MVDWIKKSARAFSEKGGIFMFIRAHFSSQVASTTDFLVTILLVKLFGVYYVYATFTGSVCGGIVIASSITNGHSNPKNARNDM